MRKGFLIYEEMRKYFPIYEEAVCNCSILNFLILYMRKFLFSFLSVRSRLVFEQQSSYVLFSAYIIVILKLFSSDILYICTLQMSPIKLLALPSIKKYTARVHVPVYNSGKKFGLRTFQYVNKLHTPCHPPILM
jgi:hypothetical protein